MRHTINILIVIMLLVGISDTITKSSALSMEKYSDISNIYLTATCEQDIADMYIKKSDPQTQTYFYIQRYCERYDVPKKIAFNVAHLETGYKGPTKNYNPYQISVAGALGAMQVLYSTAQDVWKDNPEMLTVLSKETLTNDIDYNVHTGVKYLRMLYNKYGDWSVALGFYNTGHAVINEYAIEGTR